MMIFLDIDGRISELKRKFLKKHKEKCMMNTQKELNKLWEKPEVLIYKIYAI